MVLSGYKGLEVTVDGTGIVSHRLVLLRTLADKVGLAALERTLGCEGLLVHDGYGSSIDAWADALSWL